VNYRLLALDLDGTLLDREGKVTQRDRDAVAGLQARGVVVTIVTGRLAAGAIDAARTCGIEGPIGCCDGSHLYQVGTATTMAHHALPENARIALDVILDQQALTRYVFSTDRVFCDRDGHRYASYVRTWAPQLAQLDDLTGSDEIWDRHAALAHLVIGDSIRIAAAVAAVTASSEALHAAHFSVSFAPNTHAMLVRVRGRSKGTALAELCAHHGIELEQSVAVGDWWNDVPMFEVAGRSFAMAEAPDQVKAVASDVLGDSDSSVANAIATCWPESRRGR
jgi:Cof subfamily protein (haloacid dehalogenase superfamily)